MRDFRERPALRFQESLTHNTSARGGIMSHSIFSDHDFDNILLLLVTPQSQATWLGLNMTLTCLPQQPP